MYMFLILGFRTISAKLICLSGVKIVMGRVNKNNQHKLVKDVFVNNCYHLKTFPSYKIRVSGEINEMR